MRDRQSILNFFEGRPAPEPEYAGAEWHFVEPMVTFKVLGLLALDVDASSRLLAFRIDQNELGVSPLDVPLELFAPRRAQSLAELARLAATNELKTELQPFQRFEGGVVLPGRKIGVLVRGKCRELAVWGLALGNRKPMLACGIVAKSGTAPGEPTTFVGTLTVTDYEGSYEDLTVTAPSAEAAATVLAARAGVASTRGYY